MDITGQYPFELQRLFIAALLYDSDALRECRPIMNYEHFDSRLSTAVRFIAQHFDQHQKAPSATLVASVHNIEFPNLTDLGETIEHDWLLSEYEKFAQYKALENTIMDGINLLDTDQWDELEQRIVNARQLHVRNRRSAYEPISIADLNTDKPPPRRWIYEGLLIRKFCSAFIGTGGVGKSSLALAVGLSVATGYPLLALDGDEKPHTIRRSGGVLYWNLEDPVEEVELRLAAELRHRGIGRNDITGKMFAMSGRDVPLNIVSISEKGRVERLDIAPIVDMLKRLGIVLLIVDPLGNAHTGDPNDNKVMTVVIDQFRRIADAADCSVLLVHHIRKGGQAGDVEASLGGVMMTNGCRSVDTITTMTEAEAGELGVEVATRRRYVRRTNAKLNLSPAPTECEWYQFNSVALDNGTDEYPEGDSVGVLSRWHPLPALHGYTWQDVEKVLNTVNEGTDGEYFTSDTKAARWVGNVLMQKLGIGKEQARNVVKEWLASGVMTKQKYVSKERNNQEAQRLVVPDQGRNQLQLRMANRI